MKMNYNVCSFLLERHFHLSETGGIDNTWDEVESPQTESDRYHKIWRKINVVVVCL